MALNVHPLIHNNYHIVPLLFSIIVLSSGIDNVCIEALSLHITRSTLERCYNNLNTLAEAVEEWVALTSTGYHGYCRNVTGLNSIKQNSYSQSIVTLWKV